MPIPTAPRPQPGASHGFLGHSWLSATSLALILAVPIACDGSRKASTPAKIAPDLPVQAPSILEIAPDSGRIDDEIIIKGTGFTNLSRIEFGGQPAVTFREENGTLIRVRVPTTAQTGVITLTTPGGTISSTQTFTVKPPVSPAAITAFTPPSGLAGTTEVVLTGQGFTGATQVAFGDTPCTTMTVDSDRQITATVPAGVTPGAVAISVQTPGGTLVATATFTVTAAPATPEIQTFKPVAGVPGTEVTLTGGPFAGLIRVTYAGVDLAADHYDLDSDASIRVRIPDDATASGIITLVTGAGAASTATPFLLETSRRPTFSQSFAVVPSVLDPDVHQLDFPVKRRTEQYMSDFPQAPIFHPYNPTLGNVPGARPEVLVTTFSLNFQLPASFYPSLPAEVQARLQALDIAPAQVDILCVSQNYGYDGTSGDDGIYLFRPHYWTDPSAPAFGTYSTANRVGVGLLEQPTELHFTGHTGGEFFYDVISVHATPGTTATAPWPVVSSERQFPMEGIDIRNTVSFWTVTQLNDRAAATLHILVNDADQLELNRVTRTARSLADLVTQLNGSALSGSRAVTQFKGFTRPLIMATRRAEVRGTSTHVITLSGSCFNGTTAATLDGVDLPGIQVINDATLKLIVASDANGQLVLKSPLGESTAQALPRL